MHALSTGNEATLNLNFRKIITCKTIADNVHLILQLLSANNPIFSEYSW